MTDQQIIEHLKNDRYSNALKGLYNSLPVVKSYILENNGTPDDAMDIFQDALVILYKKVRQPDFKLSTNLKHYLLSIAKNCWFYELRQRKKLPQGPGPSDIAETVTSEEDEFMLANRAFNLLGKKCKQLLILFYFKKQSFKEIAASLSFSNENVAKNQKYRCLQKAKEYYSNLSNSDTHE
jgi:RNA polymerase sigma factor (sigma-70 family)